MRRTLACTIALSAAMETEATTQAPEKPVPCEQVASIGVATMAADGTITLRVHTLPPGPIGHGMLQYPPTHAQYQEILKHLRSLAPGESKPVPPWC
jgi:hypothetical protein